MAWESAAHHMSGNSGRRRSCSGTGRLDVAADRQRRGAALDAVAVVLEVDAPELVGDELAVVGVERRVGVEVDDRWREPSAVANMSGSTEISPSCRFQYVHIGGRGRRRRRRVDVDRVRQPSSAQKCFAHGPGATTSCSPTRSALVRLGRGDRAVVARSKPVTSTPATTDRLPRGTWPAARDRVQVEREAALVLVQAAVTPCARQSGKSAFMCASTSASPDDQLER